MCIRQEWLAVADTHGHEAASKYQEGGGEMLDIVSSSSKCKKLMAAIQSTATNGRPVSSCQPFRPSAPATNTKSWGTFSSNVPVTPAHGSTQGSTVFQRTPRPVCHRCGSADHFVKFCPQQNVPQPHATKAMWACDSENDPLGEIWQKSGFSSFILLHIWSPQKHHKKSFTCSASAQNRLISTRT